MWQGEPLRPPQWRYLMSLGVQCIVDGDLQRQGAGAGTGQTEHERGSTRLTRGCVRAVRVVGAAGHDRVQFPVQQLPQRGRVQVVAGRDRFRVGAGLLHFGRSQGAQCRTGSGLSLDLAWRCGVRWKLLL
jgi:hypothetical protein